MVYIDEETGKHLEPGNVKEELGSLTPEQISVWYHYVLERPAEYKEVVIAEYPETGGKDVEFVEAVPEVGHWEMLNDSGEVLNYPIEINTDGLDKSTATPDVYTVWYYRPYSEKELAEIAKAEEEAKKQAEFVETGSDRLETAEADIEDIILLMADIVGGAI